MNCQFVIDGALQEKKRSYYSAVYAENDQEDKPALMEPKKKPAFGKLNPVTWFEKEDPASPTAD
ncbi:MAG: hypothetical protein FWH27_02585 [Planctomycetaceae bacterium]|nr:hypothetical protein [Planctomycetaceae bacterium]